MVSVNDVMRCKDTGDLVTVTRVGATVDYEGDTQEGYVRADKLTELFDVLGQTEVSHGA